MNSRSRCAMMGAKLILFITFCAFVVGAMAQAGGRKGIRIPIPELRTKDEFVEWLGLLTPGERENLFKAAEPGNEPQGTYEGAVLSSFPDFDDPRISLGNGAAMHFIFRFFPSWTGKIFNDSGIVENTVADDSDLDIKEISGSFKLENGFVDENPSWIVEYPADVHLSIIKEEIREIKVGVLLGRSFLVPVSTGDGAFWEFVLVNTDALEKTPRSSISPKRKKMGSKFKAPANKAQSVVFETQKPDNVEQRPGDAIPTFEGISDFQRWLRLNTAASREKAFESATPGAMPKGIYFGFLLPFYPTFENHTHISLEHQIFMHFYWDRWIGKSFDGEGALQNVVSDETGWVTDHLLGTIDLREGFVDGEESWHTEFPDQSVFSMFVDEFRELQPGFIYGKTFVRPVQLDDFSFFEFGLVRIEEKVQMGDSATELLLKQYMETETFSHVDKGAKNDRQGCDGIGNDINNTGDQIFFTGGPCGEPADTEISYKGNQSNQLDPALHELTNSISDVNVSSEDGAPKEKKRKNTKDVKMPELIGEGSGLNAPEFSDMTSFRDWLTDMEEDGRTRVFSAANPGPIPKGVHTGFMISEIPDFANFNISISNQAVMQFIFSQWIGKVFDGEDNLRNVLRDESAFKPEDLGGTVQLGTGFVDAKDSWIALYSEKTAYSFILDEFREIQPGFLFGKTFLKPAKRGDRTFFECGLVRVAETVPEGRDASEILKAAIAGEPQSASEPSPDSESEPPNKENKKRNS